MLLFGDEGSKKKKGTGRAPPGPSRPRGLQSNADPNKGGGFSQKSASPSNLFVPSYNEPDALRLPRLPTPDQRNEGPYTQRDSLRPAQHDNKLQPVSARDPIQRDEVEDEAGDAENRNDNRRRVSSPMVVQEQPSFRQRSRIEDEDERPEEEGRIIRVDSRLDGRAWEGDAEGERDPVAASFREARMQCQVLKKKEGSKDFPMEVKALEARLKSLEGQVMRDRITIIKRAKEQRHNSTALQKNLQDARQQMHQTMAQAADDVIVLTQKLKSVEEEFAQCRVDRDYEKMSFQNEKEIVKAQSRDTEEQLQKARMEVSELNRRMKSSNEEVKLLTKLKHDIENEAKSMQERVDALQDEVSQLKSKNSTLERQVMTLEGELSLEKNNVKNEIARVQMERERNGERQSQLQLQLEHAQQDAAQLEDLRTEATEFRRKFQQAEKLLDEAEEVRKEALANAHRQAEHDKAEAVAKMTHELETARRQLKAAQEDKTDALARVQNTVKELQTELAAANARVSEMTAGRIEAQEQLTKETDRLLAQVRKGQQEAARSSQQVQDMQESMLKEQEAAQSKQLELKTQMSELRGQAQEAQLKLAEATSGLEKATAEKREAETRAKEVREELEEVRRTSAVEDLRAEMKRLQAQLEEARREVAKWEAKAEEGGAEAQRRKEEAQRERRRAEQEGIAAAKAMAEKEVFAGMVKDLIAQLSRARMESLAAVSEREMPLEAQAAHLQSLLASARAEQPHTDAIKRKADPEVRRLLMQKYVTDFRSSRSSSVLSLSEGVPLPLSQPAPVLASDPSAANRDASAPGNSDVSAANNEVSAPESNDVSAAAPSADASSAMDESNNVQPPSEVSLVARERSDASALDRKEEDGAEKDEDPMAGVGESMVVEGGNEGEGDRPEMVITPSLPSTPGNRSPIDDLEEEEEAGAEAKTQAPEGVEGGETQGQRAEGGGEEGGKKAEKGAGEEEEEKEKEERELAAAALKIQARARGMRDRQKVRGVLEEQMAAYDEDDFEVEAGGGEEGGENKEGLAAQRSQRSLAGREGGEGEGGAGSRRGSSAGRQKPRPPEMRPEGVAGGSFRNRSGSRSGGSRPGSRPGSAMGGPADAGPGP